MKFIKNYNWVMLSVYLCPKVIIISIFHCIFIIFYYFYLISGEHCRRSELALSILETIFRFCNLDDSDGRMTSLALKLWKIVVEPVRGSILNRRNLQKFVSHVKISSRGQLQLEKLVQRMEHDLES